MSPVLAFVLVLGALPLVLVSLHTRPRLMRAVAALACLLPFGIPTSEPFLRAAGALVTWLLLVKALQYAAGHEKPRGPIDVLQFLTLPVVVRWETPRRRDSARARRALVTSLFQLGTALLLTWTVLQLDTRNPVQLITTQIGVYLILAGVFNLAAFSLALRGLDFDDPFDHPVLAKTPGEFWSRRWNTWVHHMLYRYVFAPLGGRHHPLRATFGAFAVSGLLHEGFVVVGTLVFTGWMAGFFLVQGVLVALTSQSRSFRRLSKRAPVLTWAFTLIAMFTSGVMLVRGAAGIDPSDAWYRCCL